jgi:hypothetical protein
MADYEGETVHESVRMRAMGGKMGARRERRERGG